MSQHARLAIEILTVLAAIAAVLVAWGMFWRRRLSTPHAFDAVHELSTGDGATVIVARVLPIGAPARLPPIVLVHGLAMNRHAMAFDLETSLAGALARSGRDVWCVELRGAGSAAFARHHRRSDFDTYLEHDVPAALAHVMAATGASQVDWVGFSMGGMLAYAYSASGAGTGHIRRLVTIGSPMQLRPVPAFQLIAALGAPSTLLLKRVPTGLLLAMMAPLMPPFLPGALTPGLLARNYAPGRLRRALVTAMADAPSGVIAQFARWIFARGEVSDRDGALKRLPDLARVTTPTLVIAGSRDRLAQPASVAVGFEALGAAEKQHLVIGPSSGARDDYDHLDLVLAGSAAVDVFPHVTAWLERD